MKNRAVLAFIVSATLAAVVWALSVPIAGKTEPWDAEWPYYLAALAIAGAISGAVIPKHLGVHYAGAVCGQAAYELTFLKLGPLFVLGLAFLAGYTIIFLAAAAIVASFRKGRPSETNAVTTSTKMQRTFALRPCPVCHSDVPSSAAVGPRLQFGERFVCPSCNSQLERKSPKRTLYSLVILVIGAALATQLPQMVATIAMLILAVVLVRWAFSLKRVVPNEESD